MSPACFRTWAITSHAFIKRKFANQVYFLKCDVRIYAYQLRAKFREICQDLEPMTNPTLAKVCKIWGGFVVGCNSLLNDHVVGESWVATRDESYARNFYKIWGGFFMSYDSWQNPPLTSGPNLEWLRHGFVLMTNSPHGQGVMRWKPWEIHLKFAKISEGRICHGL